MITQKRRIRKYNLYSWQDSKCTGQVIEVLMDSGSYAEMYHKLHSLMKFVVWNEDKHEWAKEPRYKFKRFGNSYILPGFINTKKMFCNYHIKKEGWMYVN